MLPIMSLGNCKLKQDGTARLLEWRKSQTRIAPNAGGEAEPREFSFPAGGKAKRCGRGDVLSRPGNHALWSLPPTQKSASQHLYA